ncbi:MAG: ABC transporter substrate-binding protein [Alphaproteobacteria bacterium]|nr:ABC transporter substrate-binding protein [Alphaproteobacteria bacterium]
MKKYAALVLGLVLMASPALAAPATGAPIKIGDINVGTKFPDYSAPYKHGMALAIEEANANGGINGRPLEIISRDSKMDPGHAIRLAEELIARDEVSLLVTGDASNVTLAVSNWGKQKKFPVINTIADADTIMWEHGHDYIFRITFGGYHEMSALIKSAYDLHKDKMKGKRWAIVAANYEYGRSLGHTAKIAAEQQGLNPQWVIEQWPAYGKMDAGATIAAVQQAEPDIIVVLTPGSDFPKFVREGNKRGLFKNRIVLAPEGCMREHLDVLKNEMPSGWICIGFPFDEIQDTKFAKFRQDYQTKYHEPLRTFSLYGYNAGQATVAALRKADSTDPKKVHAALKTVSFDTPLGEQHFREIDHQANTQFWVGLSSVNNGQGTMINWHVENTSDYSPTDAWILEQRAKAAEGKKGE